MGAIKLLYILLKDKIGNGNKRFYYLWFMLQQRQQSVIVNESSCFKS